MRRAALPHFFAFIATVVVLCLVMAATSAAVTTTSYVPTLQLYNSSSPSYTTALTGVLLRTRFDPAAQGTRVLALRALQAVVLATTSSASAASYYATLVYNSHMTAVTLSGASPAVGIAGCAAATADTSLPRDVGLLVTLPDVDTTDASAPSAILTPSTVAQIRWSFAVAVATHSAAIVAVDGGALGDVVPLPLPTSVGDNVVARSTSDASLPYSFCTAQATLAGVAEPAEATYAPDDVAYFRAEAQRRTHHGTLGFLAAAGLLVVIVAVSTVAWTAYRRSVFTSSRAHLPSLSKQKMAARAAV